MKKDKLWYLKQIEEHIEEIRDLIYLNKIRYNKEETCGDHAKIEAYDLIMLVSLLFEMDEIKEAIPEYIHKRFKDKELKEND